MTNWASSGSTVSKRPLIAAKSRDLTGSYRETAEFAQRGMDLTFVEGYSDKRQAIDSDLAQGRRPETGLTHRLQYVTVEDRSGKANRGKVQQFRAMGYRPIEFDHPEAFGIQVPPQAFRNAEGHIQVGDAVLYVCDAATAARNEAHGRSAIDERTSDEVTGAELRSAADSLGAVGQGTVTGDMNWTKQDQRSVG